MQSQPALKSKTVRVAIAQASIGVAGILAYLVVVFGNPELAGSIVAFLAALQIKADPVFVGSVILIAKSLLDYYLRSITTKPLQ
jgi:hypothetical protein